MNRRERREKKEELNVLEGVITIIKQYFPELINKFEGLTDTRHQSYITYKMRVIFIVRLMGLMCEIKTMHELTREFNTKEAINNIAKICGLELEEIPHCDTINEIFKKVKIEEIEEIRKYMIIKMIRSKMLERFKIRGKYYHIVIDGTGLATSKKKYNKNCLVKNKTDKEGAIPSLYKEFETIVKTDNESKIDEYSYVTKLDYQGKKTNIIKYVDKKKGTEFMYMTDLSITNKNIKETIYLGRQRWKIENEGFNAQKNGTFDIGHLYSKDSTAIKAHYLMIQIAHIIRQLLENGIKEIKELKLKLKEISQQVKKQLISTITNLTALKKVQLRFD